MGNAVVCWKCGDGLKNIAWPITRMSHCPACFAELHCCVACRKYAPKFHTKCSDERADPPERKDSANFCNWFSPRPGAYDAAGHSADRNARAAAAALFGSDKPVVDTDRPDDGLSDTERALRDAERLFRGGD